MLYSPYSLFTHQRKRNQIVLIKDLIRSIKAGFNKDFGELLANKEDEMAKIAERNE